MALPFDLEKLNNLCDEYIGYGKSYARLTEVGVGGKGCGGIGVLWHKSFDATPITNLSSDRLCAIRFRVQNGDRSIITIIGVYLPCSDKGIETCQEHLAELERCISESSLLGGVTVLGDFNAHLGSLSGIRGCGDSNVQGVLVGDMVARCHLSAIFLCSVSSGPIYTYVSGSRQTTIDYIFADEVAASLLIQCHTLPMEDLNTSDHLPLIADMMYSPVFKVPDPISIKIDWRLAISSGDIETYRNTVADHLNRMASNNYECIEDVEKELNFVCNLLSCSILSSSSSLSLEVLLAFPRIAWVLCTQQ